MCFSVGWLKAGTGRERRHGCDHNRAALTHPNMHTTQFTPDFTKNRCICQYLINAFVHIIAHDNTHDMDMRHWIIP